jgi:hypothetical protein
LPQAIHRPAAGNPARDRSAAGRLCRRTDLQAGYLWWNNSHGRWPGTPGDGFAANGKLDNDLLIVPSLDLLALRKKNQRNLSPIGLR